MCLRLLQEWAERNAGPVWCITLKTTILGPCGSIGSAAEHRALHDIKSTGVAILKKKSSNFSCFCCSVGSFANNGGKKSSNLSSLAPVTSINSGRINRPFSESIGHSASFVRRWFTDLLCCHVWRAGWLTHTHKHPKEFVHFVLRLLSVRTSSGDVATHMYRYSNVFFQCAVCARIVSC